MNEAFRYYKAILVQALQPGSFAPMSSCGRVLGIARRGLRPGFRAGGAAAALARFTAAPAPAAPAEKETRFDIGAGPGAAGMSLAEWSRQKNANKGPPVSGAVQWTPDEDVPITVVPLDGATRASPGLLIRGALTAQECAAGAEPIPYLGSRAPPSFLPYRIRQDSQKLRIFIWICSIFTDLRPLSGTSSESDKFM